MLAPYRHWVPVGIILFASTAAAVAQPAEPRYPRMYSINFQPYIESTSERLNVFGGWNNPRALNAEYFDDFQTASHGLVNWRHHTELDFDYYPILADGFRYNDATYTSAVNQWQSGGGQGGFHLDAMVDYKRIAVNFDFARRVDFGEIDEVNNNCAPFFGYWETTMMGRGGYWCNSGPQQRVASSKIWIILGLNYERGVAEMIHSYTHRTESILRHAFGDFNWHWNLTNPQNLWDHFSLAYGTSAVNGRDVFGVGHCHFPPNGENDYDYANTRTVLSTAPMWTTMDPADPHDYPDISGTPVSLSRSAWGGPDYHRNYLNWFYSHMPHFDGTTVTDGKVRLNNWWEYLNFFNDHAESGGDFAKHNNPAPAEPLGETIVQLSSDTEDDWRPMVNANGRVAWISHGSRRVSIGTNDATNTNEQSIGGYRAAELLQMNDNDQIVYQMFDGYDFEIFTTNADGTVVYQITDNDVQDWHADISNTGRIVWEQFDGEDFEIVSADFDGGNLTQLTSNSHGGNGYPREDMWPRINNNDRVVWMGWDGDAWEIFSGNADGTDVVQLVNTTFEDEFPEINDNGTVVWHAWHSNNYAEIWTADAYSANSGARETFDYNKLNWWPQINNNDDLVWMSRRYGDNDSYNWQIVLNGTALTDNATHDQHPVIDDDGRIAWQGFDGNDFEIYVYVNGAIKQVTDNEYDDQAPQLATEGPLVWHAESELGDPSNARYAGPTTEIFTVSAAVTKLLQGDMNCDGAVDFFDIDPFILALLQPSSYMNTYPDCDLMLADGNGDGSVSFFDIDPFVSLLLGN